MKPQPQPGQLSAVSEQDVILQLKQKKQQVLPATATAAQGGGARRKLKGRKLAAARKRMAYARSFIGKKNRK